MTNEKIPVASPQPEARLSGQNGATVSAQRVPIPQKGRAYSLSDYDTMAIIDTKGGSVWCCDGGDGSCPRINDLIGRLLGSQRASTQDELGGAYPLCYLESYVYKDDYEVTFSFQPEDARRIMEILTEHYWNEKSCWCEYDTQQERVGNILTRA